MEGEIYFDASRYPRYHEAVEEHMSRMRRVHYLCIASMAFLGIFLAVFLSWVYFPMEALILLAALYFGMSAFYILFIRFVTKRLKRDYEQKPLRITDKGIEFLGTVTPFDLFDRIVNTEEVIRSAGPGYVSIAKGRKAIRTYRMKSLGDPGEFVRVLKRLRPEIRIDLK
jgi:hypothetical protein